MSFYQFSRAFLSLFKSGVYDYCNLETPDGDNESPFFATRNNGFTSVIEIHGSFSHVGKSRLESFLKNYIDRTSSGLSRFGQTIDYIYVRDPGRGPDVAKRAVDPLRKAMRKRRLDFNFFLDEQEKLLGEDLVYESIHIVLTTNLATLDKTEQKLALEDRDRKAKNLGTNVYVGDFAMNPLAVVDRLRSTHESNVESLEKGLKEICSFSKLTCEEILAFVRKESAPNFTGDNWKGSLPSESGASSIRFTRESPVDWDQSNALNPSAGYQVFPLVPSQSDADRSIVQIGNTYQAPIMVDTPPSTDNVRPFSDLTGDLPRDIPVRVVLTMETGHKTILKKIGSRKNRAMAVGWSSSQSKGVYNSAKALIDLANEDVLVNCTMTANTWSDSLSDAQRNKNRLAKALQNWSNIEVIEEKADSVRAWITTLPTFSHQTIRIASTWPYPLKSAVRLAPFTKPASPYASGPVLGRSLNSTLYPIMPTSSQQTTWLDYYFAPPGRGKSVTISYHNISFLLNPFYQTLPCLSILDIGPSARNTIELIKEALPEDEKHIAQFYQLKMRRDSGLNPLDTPLGCRYPTTHDRDTQRSILKAAFAPTGALAKKGIPMLDEFCSMLIERLFLWFSDDNGDESNPKPYEEQRDSRIDEALLRHSIEASSGSTPWWTLVDRLFDAGDVVNAARAQRFAVPNLMDISEVMSEDQLLKRSFGDLDIGNNLSLYEYITTMLRTIARDLPIIAGETQLDIANARIIAMDLADVTPQGTQEFDVKQTSLMFLLGRFAIGRHFYRRQEDIGEFNPHYQDYHYRVIDDISQAPKCLVLDEIHRCVKFEAVLEQLILDAREGRKHNVRLALASQLLEDLPDDLAEMVQNYYVMSIGNSQSAPGIIKKLKIHSDTVRAMEEYCSGPGYRGLFHLLLSEINDEGETEHHGSRSDNIVNLRQGPMMLLGQSTTDEDRNIRSRLSSQLGLSNALRVMSKEVPGGKSKPYIEARVRKGDFDDLDENIYDHIAQEIIEKHSELIAE